MVCPWGPPMPPLSVAVHGLKRVSPRRRASVTITPYELRVSDSDTTDRRSRRGTITVIATTTSGSGCPNWLQLAARRLGDRIAAGGATLDEAWEIVREIRGRRVRWSEIAPRLEPRAREIAEAASPEVAMLAAGVKPDRWAEYNRKMNDLLMRKEGGA